MLIKHSEKNKLRFNGTIIDLESIGNFCYDYCDEDSRRYNDITLTIFGYIDGGNLNIFCAEGVESLEELKIRTTQILPALKRPLFAFNCCFEMGLLYHSCGLQIEFDGDLMKEKVADVKWENKQEACAELGISNHNDPFNGVSRMCSPAWLNGNWEDVINHNRSCLLTERDILLKRGYRKPDPFIFYPI